MILIDSNALIWLLTCPDELSGTARAVMQEVRSLHVSAACIWEIEIKRAAGRLDIGDFGWDAPVASGDITVVPIQPADAARAARLAPHHRDPFDRMLIAQALNRDAAIVTRDGSFAPYGVRLIMA